MSEISNLISKDKIPQWLIIGKKWKAFNVDKKFNSSFIIYNNRWAFWHMGAWEMLSVSRGCAGFGLLWSDEVIFVLFTLCHRQTWGSKNINECHRQGRKHLQRFFLIFSFLFGCRCPALILSVSFLPAQPFLFNLESCGAHLPAT